MIAPEVLGALKPIPVQMLELILAHERVAVEFAVTYAGETVRATEGVGVAGVIVSIYCCGAVTLFILPDACGVEIVLTVKEVFRRARVRGPTTPYPVVADAP